MTTLDRRSAALAACAFAVLLSLPLQSRAQLADCALIDEAFHINAPGGCIGKPLRDQVGPGQGDVNTQYSSIYLIKRDPARAIRRGRQLFQRKWSLEEGLGPRLNAFSRGDITKHRALGAGLSDSCAACHGRPRGSAGVRRRRGHVPGQPRRAAPVRLGLDRDAFGRDHDRSARDSR